MVSDRKGPPLRVLSGPMALAACFILVGSASAQRGPAGGPLGRRDPEMEVTQKHNLQVAKWYLEKRKAYEGARDRLQEILEQDPEFSQIDEVVYLLGETNEKLRKPEIAVKYYKKLLKDYPGSQFSKKARERLADLKLPPDEEDEKSKDNSQGSNSDDKPDSDATEGSPSFSLAFSEPNAVNNRNGRIAI